MQSSTNYKILQIIINTNLLSFSLISVQECFLNNGSLAKNFSYNPFYIEWTVSLKFMKFQHPGKYLNFLALMRKIKKHIYGKSFDVECVHYCVVVFLQV